MLGFSPGGFHGLFFFPAKLFVVFFTLLFNFRGLLTQPLCLLTGGLHLLTLLFQLGQNILKVLVALIDQVIRFLQDLLGKP